MTTAEVVDALERARRRLLGALDALGDSQSTACVTEDGGWTAKDVLAHLVHYAGQIAFGLGAPEQPPPYVVGVHERLTPQQWNDRAVAYWRDRSLDDVRAEFERITDVIIDTASRRSDDDMNASGTIPWAGAVPLWQFIGGDTFLSEWPAHAAQMERAAG
jgi:hypothetical protein